MSIWNDIQCAKNPCPNGSFTSINVPIVATASGACPEGWHQFATSCYAFIDAQPLVWTEAVVCFVLFVCPVREHFIHIVTSLLPLKACKIRAYAQCLRFWSRGSLSVRGSSVKEARAGRSLKKRLRDFFFNFYTCNIHGIPSIFMWKNIAHRDCSETGAISKYVSSIAFFVWNI